ncbi:hypothetical protein CDL12_08764 [Handroanthus impetiginosus]|uniref:Uncharacterized protein n=1 Tax=Handroanthus impetiginosus TaxID=429701 RepID=A0A2G9HM29_9LAMI|nr:hypothetical protein CDL12_08764 [Handroanthus impetiginosus]
MNFLEETLSFLSSDSLFSTIITFYTLVLLYLPSIFLQFISSPVVLSTLILLLYLLRLGAAQTQNSTSENESDFGEFNSAQSLQIEESVDPDQRWNSGVSNTDTEIELCSEPGPDPNRNPHPFYVDFFVEWDVRAPLEVIYEEHEGEDAEENGGVSEAKRESEMNIIQRYASLSLFYPESDSDSSLDGDFPAKGDWDSPENMRFRWEEDDDKEGLIEIALDEKRSSEVDEENLIEIDLSPAR